MKLMEATALGFGSLKKDESAKAIRRHQQNISGDIKEARRPQKLTMGLLQQLGIPMEKKS